MNFIALLHDSFLTHLHILPLRRYINTYYTKFSFSLNPKRKKKRYGIQIEDAIYIVYEYEHETNECAVMC